MFGARSHKPTGATQQQIDDAEDQADPLQLHSCRQIKVERLRLRRVDQIMSRRSGARQANEGQQTRRPDNHQYDAEKFAHSFRHYSPPIKKCEGATLLSKKRKFAVQNRGVIKSGRIVPQSGKVITAVLWKKHRSRII
jgi:hypothetical protein